MLPWRLPWCCLGLVRLGVAGGPLALLGCLVVLLGGGAWCYLGATWVLGGWLGLRLRQGVDDDEQINRGEIDGADLSMSRSVEEWRRGDDEAEGERGMVWTRGAGRRN